MELFVAQSRFSTAGSTPAATPGATTLLFSGSPSASPDGHPAREVRDTAPQSFEAFQQSLQKLIHLAERDPTALVDLFEELEEDVTPKPITEEWASAWPMTPKSSAAVTYPVSPTSTLSSDGAVDPGSHAARRRRKSKLTQFFGETNVDFSDPPSTLDVMRQRQRGRHGPKTDERNTNKAAFNSVNARLQTFDNILGEMWRIIQIELKVGRMGLGEGEMLTQMMEGLRSTVKGRASGWEGI
jgi:hypothetical protein